MLPALHQFINYLCGFGGMYGRIAGEMLPAAWWKVREDGNYV